MAVTHPYISHVEQIIKGYSCGITMPLLCLLENAQLAVVKYPHNQVGNQVLVNEWVCNKIATQIGLSVPLTGCCLIDNESAYGEEFQDQLISGDASFDKCNYGISFYSSFVANSVPLQASNIRNLANLEDFWKMLLFDQIVCNVDRHRGNVLYSLVERKFYAIDCSNVFNSQRGWTEHSLLDSVNEKHYANLELLLPTANGEIYDYFWSNTKTTPDQILDIALQVQKALTPNVICAIIKSMPDEWKEWLGQAKSVAMEQYLNYRVRHIIETTTLIIQERGMK